MWKMIVMVCCLAICGCAVDGRQRVIEQPRRIWIFEAYCFDLFDRSDFRERAFEVLRYAPPDEMYVIGNDVQKIYDTASGKPMPTAEEVCLGLSRYQYSSGELLDVFYYKVFDQLAKGHTELTLFSGGVHSPIRIEPVVNLVKERAKTDPLSISVITRNAVFRDTLDFHRALIVRGSLTILSEDPPYGINTQGPAKLTSSQPATQPAAQPAPRTIPNSTSLGRPSATPESSQEGTR